MIIYECDFCGRQSDLGRKMYALKLINSVDFEMNEENVICRDCLNELKKKERSRKENG